MTGIKLIEKCSAGASSSILLGPDPSLASLASLASLPLWKSPTKKWCQKAHFRILQDCSGSSPEAANHPSPHLQRSPLDHVWAQTQLMENASSLFTDRLYNLSALVLKHGFSCLGSGAGEPTQVLLCSISLIWLTVAWVEKPSTAIQKTY